MEVVFPTAYFGSIAYFQSLLRHEQVCIEVCDTFPKQTFRNRCRILGPQGSQRLTLPVVKPNGSKSLTREITVSESQDWRMNHWRSIQTAYASSPYFDHYALEIEQLIFTKEPSLIKFNRLITETILSLFDCSVVLLETKEYTPQQNSTADYQTIDYELEETTNFVSIPYTQVLFKETTFQPNPSILDLLFCEGPMGRKLLITS